MPKFRLAILAGALAAAVVAAPTVWPTALADDSGPAEEDKSAEELAREGMEKIMRALEHMMDSIPQYEMPEVTEDGDIIIRRKNPPPKDAPDDDEEAEPVPEATET
ncbi:MAG: hypothetical protein R3316_03080 [Rhodovibrionaceae bacterium]|nr:hypothetical protein [Rhodovibrionaceae bacterium]